MAPPSHDHDPASPAQAIDLRLVLESMVEMATFHEIVSGPDGRAVDYRILDCNAAFTRVTGIPRERAVGRLASEVYGSVPYLETYARVAATGEPERFDTFFPPMDRHFSISVVSPRGGCFVTIASDITERQRSAEALLRYRALAESARDVILFVRRDDGRIIDANAAALSAYGYDREELLALTVFDLREHATLGATTAQMTAADEMGLRFETVHRKKDGTTFPAEVSSVGATLNGVRVLISVIRDASERKEAERRIAAERERLSVTLRSIGDAVIATDEVGRVSLMNEVAERLTGWTAADAAGKPLLDVFDVVNEKTRAPIGDPLERVLREGRVVGLAEGASLIARDGTERPIADSGAPIRDAHGQVIGLVLVFRDRTEECRAEAERERLRHQLAQAQKLESVGRLAGGIAHDFNNLLTVIMSCAELLKAALASGSMPSMGDVEDIAASGARARDLTSRLLAFARKQGAISVPLDLNEVVRGTEKLLRRSLGEKIRTAVALQPGLWLVRGDPNQLEQVILDLALNARDAMPGGGELFIETANVERGSDAENPDAELVRLVVRDTGTGILPEAQQHLFEPFFTTKPRGQGTGLGLATVYGIVAQGEGHIRVRTEEGRGTIVEVLLPRTGDPVQPQAAPVRAPSTGGDETVLVVEDDERVREVTVRALRSAGYRVLTAVDGQEGIALALAEHDGVDLLVTDVVMPGADGLSVAKAFQRIHPRAKVLFVSGYAQDAIAAHGILDAGIELLAKPFTPSALLARVRAVLEGEHGGGRGD